MIGNPYVATPMTPPDVERVVDTERILLVILKKIQTNVNKDTGICSQINHQLYLGYFWHHRILVNLLRDELFSTWEYHSGDECFPVPLMLVPKPFRKILNWFFDPEDVFKTSNKYTKWSGKYGVARNHLLNHMINELETRINER